MNNIWGFLLFSIAALLALRGFMGTGVRSFLTKNERKKYHANTSGIDRWFFWSVPNLISDGYSKSEKRRISYASTLKAYRVINLAAHIGLTVVLLFIVCYFAGYVGARVLNTVCIADAIMILLMFVVLAVIEFWMNRRYHLTLYRNKK